MIALLLFTGIYFTLRSRGVQFRMFGEMIRLLCSSGKRESGDSSADGDTHHTVSSFQAFGNGKSCRRGNRYRHRWSRLNILDVDNSITWFGLGFRRVNIGAIV